MSWPVTYVNLIKLGKRLLKIYNLKVEAQQSFQTVSGKLQVKSNLLVFSSDFKSFVRDYIINKF